MRLAYTCYHVKFGVLGMQKFLDILKPLFGRPTKSFIAKMVNNHNNVGYSSGMFCRL